MQRIDLKKIWEIIGKRWTCFLLAGCLATMFQAVAFADGMPAAPEGPANPPSANIGPGVWPPGGAVPRGPFVAGGFAGTWYAFVDNTAFTLTIEQEGLIIKLAHTAIYDYGRRIDSSVGGVSMAGTVSGSLAYLEWKSGLSPENGKATLEYLPGRPVTLHWKIIDPPKKAGDQAESATPLEVSYFLPASAFLIRK